jgi:hypothetical protein
MGLYLIGFGTVAVILLIGVNVILARQMSLDSQGAELPEDRDMQESQPFLEQSVHSGEASPDDRAGRDSENAGNGIPVGPQEGPEGDESGVDSRAMDDAAYPYDHEQDHEPVRTASLEGVRSEPEWTAEELATPGSFLRHDAALREELERLVNEVLGKGESVQQEAAPGSATPGRPVADVEPSISETEESRSGSGDFAGDGEPYAGKHVALEKEDESRNREDAAPALQEEEPGPELYTPSKAFVVYNTSEPWSLEWMKLFGSLRSGPGLLGWIAWRGDRPVAGMEAYDNVLLERVAGLIRAVDQLAEVTNMDAPRSLMLGATAGMLWLTDLRIGIRLVLFLQGEEPLRKHIHWLKEQKVL